MRFWSLRGSRVRNWCKRFALLLFSLFWSWRSRLALNKGWIFSSGRRLNIYYAGNLLREKRRALIYEGPFLAHQIYPLCCKKGKESLLILITRQGKEISLCQGRRCNTKRQQMIGIIVNLFQQPRNVGILHEYIKYRRDQVQRKVPSEYFHGVFILHLHNHRSFPVPATHSR